MAFPQTPRDIIADLFLSGGWRDVSADIRGASGISTVRSRRGGGTKSQASSCIFTLNDRNGDYSPRNPLGQWYGFIGQATPVRIAIGAARDTFSRSVSNSWGTCDTGRAWSTVGAGGSVLSSQWNVAGGVGTHAVPSAAAYRASYLSTLLVSTIDVAVTVTLGFSDVTGGSIEPANIILRGQSTTNYYMVRVSIDTAEAVTISIMHYSGTVIAASTATGLTHSSGQALRVRASIEGSTIRAKVWAASGLEPFGWQVSGYATTITGYGWIGIRSGVGAGNTNIPVTFSYDNVVVSYPRFYGEIGSLKPGWDDSGKDIIAEVDAGSILRRIGQGNSPIGSSMKRGLTRGSPEVVAYWPCEDPRTATRISPGIPGIAPMDIIGAGTTFATNTDFDCSDPLPTPGASTWLGRVPAHTVVDRTQTRFLLSIPGGGVADQTLFSAFLSGTAYRISVDINSAGSMRVAAYNTADVLIIASAYNLFAMNGVPKWVSLEYRQANPTTIAIDLAVLAPGASTGLSLSLGGITVTGTMGITKLVQVHAIGSVPVGHISVHRQWTSLFDLGQELAAWDGERAVDRASRLCTEEGIPFILTGNATDSPQMGPVGSNTLGELLAACAEMDLGTLSEAIGDAGIYYRTLSSTYNQSAGLTLDYSLGQVAPPFEPTDDDQMIRNDITVKRVKGGEAHAELTTGRLSVQAPKDGGIGRRDTSYTVNAYSIDQLPDMAGWLLHIGTVDETRYSTIGVDLANPNVVAAGLEPTVMGINMDDRLVIINPKSTQSPDSISQLARGYTEYISTLAHTVRFTCEPESPFNVIELDSGIQRLDSDVSTLTSNISNNATSFQVSMSDESIWSTSSGDWPIPVTIGGESMLVGSVTGSTSPQTFSSVTRSVNGVVKAHNAGTPVHVVNPAYLALWG